MRGRKSCPGYPERPRSLAEHLKKVRLDRGLLQKEVAREVGCSKDTLRNYEAARVAPEIRYWPAIMRFLGYDPRPEPSTWPERLRFAREGRGLTQGELALLLGVDIRTVNSWETGHEKPGRRSSRALQGFLASCPG